MDVQLFTQILRDPNFFNLKKMQYKFGQDALEACLAELRASHFEPLPLRDFQGQNLVYLPQQLRVRPSSVRLLYSPHTNRESYGVEAMTQEIYHSLRIENIASSRKAIRELVVNNSSGSDLTAHGSLQDQAGQEDHEDQELAPSSQSSPAASADILLGMKKALDLISQPSYKISTEHLQQIYQLAIGPGLSPENQIPAGSLYRHDSVNVVGHRMGDHVHMGLAAEKLPAYMAEFIAFAQAKDDFEPLYKAAILHFYLAYLHPYFDGNGRTARLFHLWHLVQAGFPAALFVSFSSYIEESKKAYYQAFQWVEQNQKISGVLDVTPFVAYFVNQVYNRLPTSLSRPDTLDRYRELHEQGKITPKERELWNFILSFYGLRDFSSKELEKDFGQAAYATIYKFIQKFHKFQLLEQTDFSTRPRYKVRS